MYKILSKLVIAAVVVAAVTIGCVKLTHKSDKPEEVIAAIPPNVKSETVIASNKVTVTTKVVKKRDGKTQETTKRIEKYIPPEATVKYTVKDDGEVDVKVNTKGFCHTLEIAVLRDMNHSYLGVGAKFFYWSRFSASVGAEIYDFNKVRFKPYVSVDYTIPYLKNTKVGLNYNFSNIGIKLSISL
ncbi:hypothetical protein AGMMS49593_08420 [Endomicrobiia bacterium]|nr:hypothetical protein AGMMS49593_08420 [Endomicrobiia bacterium]